ncbi:MAG: hypothetical protein JSW11_15320 [Candidatus Heimdallarchaeota archaeon]|nr:MAG: hypothetical protein JSW11_15320 [Candidatus Heimdallarchaeota archaeon]
MNKKEENETTHEKIERATKNIFREWEVLDKINEPTQETLEFLKQLEELVKKEVKNEKGEIKVIKATKQMIRTRKDFGDIVLGDNVVKKIEIIDKYEGYSRPLKSIAYYNLLPEADAKKPIVRVLEWTVSHHPSWVIWFTSPVAKGFKSRTEGEYLIAHSLNEKESEDYDLLLKFNKFPCFGRSDGIDILLGYEKRKDAVKFVEEFLRTIIKRNLYGDQEFLKFLQNYRKTKLKLANN